LIFTYGTPISIVVGALVGVVIPSNVIDADGVKVPFGDADRYTRYPVASITIPQWTWIAPALPPGSALTTVIRPGTAG